MMDAQDLHTPPHGLKRLHYYSISMVTFMSVYCTDLHVCTCTMVFKAIFIINTTDSYGHVRMHVYIHLAFKALNGVKLIPYYHIPLIIQAT